MLSFVSFVRRVCSCHPLFIREFLLSGYFEALCSSVLDRRERHQGHLRHSYARKSAHIRQNSRDLTCFPADSYYLSSFARVFSRRLRYLDSIPIVHSPRTLSMPPNRDFQPTRSCTKDFGRLMSSFDTCANGSQHYVPPLTIRYSHSDGHQKSARL